MKISRRKILVRRSPLQKAIQQDARKTVNSIRGLNVKTLNLKTLKTLNPKTLNLKTVFLGF